MLYVGKHGSLTANELKVCMLLYFDDISSNPKIQIDAAFFDDFMTSSIFDVTSKY